MFVTRILNTDRPVRFFEDDTIEIVRQQIGLSSDCHPDRLFILIGVELSRHYYTQDKRNWDLLFHRLSMNGAPIEREMFESYVLDYRVPALKVGYQSYDRDLWMSYPPELHDLWDPPGEFTEYWIFGVEDQRSFCLPQKINTVLTNRIIAAETPVPDNSKLFMSFYDKKSVKGFWVMKYEEEQGPYFPLLRQQTPQKLSESQIILLENNFKHIEELLSLDPPIPKKTNILKVVWYAELVDTEMEEHVRTRFEQMFYGLTVSSKVPCVTFLTSLTDISRHKFFTENVKTKKPYLDIPMWSSWWTKSRPSRSRPTLVLYRGKSREWFDRISITSSDISFAVYRDSSETKTIEELRDQLIKWFKSFDSIVPFFKESDLKKCRWSTESIKFEVEYSKTVDEIDTSRLNCISSIFNQDKNRKDIFKFLRADYALEGLSVSELHVIEMIKDNEFVTPKDVEQELKISESDASKILSKIRMTIEENPRILERKTRGFPLIQFLPNSAIVSSVTDIERPTNFTNILRYILSNPTSKQLDKICPKKVESSESRVAVSNIEYNLDDSFGDIFGYLETSSEIKEDVEEDKPQRIGKKSSKYGYFVKKLEEFDPGTFDPANPSTEYPGSCEQSHQPVALSEAEVSKLLPEYNPRNDDASKILEWKDPDGIIVCPEYWCMYDKIPLKKDQLISENGTLSCPVCGGKVRTMSDTKSDQKEFSVIPRTKGYQYPGYRKKPPISPANFRELPCCFKTPMKETKVLKDNLEGKYYINRETKTQLEELRFSYLPESLLESLDIVEDYSIIKKSGSRIISGMSGFFRVGLGRPSSSVPKLFGIDKKIPVPHEAVKWVLNCSFLHSWTKIGDSHLELIESELSKKIPFDKDELARKNIAKLISGISVAFQEGKLTQFQEVEYVCLFLGIDIYRVLLDSNSMGCLFYSQQVKASTLGIILLERGEEIDCLTHITRIRRDFQYVANIFDKPFTSDVVSKLADLRVQVCHLSIPIFDESYEVFNDLFPGKLPTLILDPFGRSEAFFLENEILLPFKNTPLPANMKKLIYKSYSDIASELPSMEKMIGYLKTAQTIHPGYEMERQLHDSDGNIVEILLKCGLRVPVQPEKSEGLAEEVLASIIQEGETNLTFGEPNKEDIDLYKKISYADEVYNFIIFELTTDLELDDYSNLKVALSTQPPTRKVLEPLLEAWFSHKILFKKIENPIEFISKIRKPCGQFTSMMACETSHMCGWDGQCKVEVRDTFNKQRLFTKLLTNLLENSKTRYMILDGRTTPFFSTILYLELPHEKIVTDLDLKQGTV